MKEIMIQDTNLVVSFIIMLTSLFILFRHYSSKKSKIDERLTKWQFSILKVGLIFMSMGTFFNLIKDKPTPYSEVLLNVGLSLFMVFIAILFEKAFVNKNMNIVNDR